MTLEVLSVTNLKQKIFALIEQLPAEQLPKLLYLLEQWLKQSNALETNGTVLKSSPTNMEMASADQPWLRYTDRLKDSLNWDEFLDAIAQARHTNEDNVDK